MIQQGTLIGIGGALKLDGAAFKSFYQRAGGEDGRVVILPTASLLAESGASYVEGLERLGLKCRAEILPIRQREDAEQPEFAEMIRSATGIFLGGGDQARLSKIITGTPAHAALLDAYDSGAVIGGTSAGTAVLSEIMIARGFSGALPRGGIAHFATGLGFNRHVIFDQHFRQRNRIGRLMYTIALYPNLIGIGVDEDTAAIINGDILTVAGPGTVTIVDGSGLTETDAAAAIRGLPVTFSSLRIHSLTAGCMFDLAERCAQILIKQLN